MKSIGRPKLQIMCDQLPGVWFVRDAAKATGLNYYSIMSGIKRGAPVGPHKIMFSRYVPRVKPSADLDAIEQWCDKLEYASERCGHESHGIVFGDGYVEGEKMKVLGVPIERHYNFEDLECALHSIVTLMLDRNPLRDELFSACRTVLPMIYHPPAPDVSK